MELTEQLGREIIDRLYSYIDVPVNLMDPDGKIVASTDPSRIHQIHGGAQQVIAILESQTITENEADRYSNARPGVNLPIFHKSRLAGVVGLTGNPDEVMQAARMTRGTVEIALEQIYLLRQTFYQERQWNEWLQQLLHPDDLNVKAMEAEAMYTLGVEVEHLWQVLIFQSEEDIEIDYDISRIVDHFHMQPLFSLPYQNHDLVVALPYKNRGLPIVEVFQNRFPNVSIGVGNPAFGVSGLRSSFRQARDTIEFAEKGTIVHCDTVQMERMLSHIEDGHYEEITSTYKKRLHQLEAIYMETLQSYFSLNLKMNRTAECLHIHRNTLIYRLDQISKKVGLDPRIFKESIILQTILIKR